MANTKIYVSWDEPPWDLHMAMNVNPATVSRYKCSCLSTKLNCVT